MLMSKTIIRDWKENVKIQKEVRAFSDVMVNGARFRVESPIQNSEK